MADAPDLGFNPRLARRVSTGRIVAFPHIFSQSVFPIAPVAPDAPDSSAKVAQKSAVPKSGTTITRSGEAIGDSIAAHLDPDRITRGQRLDHLQCSRSQFSSTRGAAFRSHYPVDLHRIWNPPRREKCVQSLGNLCDFSTTLAVFDFGSRAIFRPL
jgi:hypothetical protein